MTRAHRKDGFIRVVQGKTGEELWIPEHRELTAELDRGETGITSLLTTHAGSRSIRSTSARGLPKRSTRPAYPTIACCTGCEKRPARTLAEAGCSERKSTILAM